MFACQGDTSVLPNGSPVCFSSSVCSTLVYAVDSARERTYVAMKSTLECMQCSRLKPSPLARPPGGSRTLNKTVLVRLHRQDRTGTARTSPSAAPLQDPLKEAAPSTGAHGDRVHRRLLRPEGSLRKSQVAGARLRQQNRRTPAAQHAAHRHSLAQEDTCAPV